MAEATTTTRGTEPQDGEAQRPGRWSSLDRLLLAAAALPFVVAAMALLFGVGSSYVPVSDAALAEMLVRDVGRHPLTVGLYSRDDWSHPGPLLYHLLAPFYWLTGSSSVGLNVGALAINGASVLGMGMIARHRAGTAGLMATLVGTALAMRTLGAEFLHDAWNCYVTVLPFGLLAFLVWALLAGERWALPLGVFVASYLAQTHIGFVALALPLLALGAVGLVVVVLRRDGTAEGRRSLVRPVGIAAAVGAVVWLPTAIDTVTGGPRNMVNAIRWFRAAEGGVHTVSDGLKVMSGQFGIWPEWATTTRRFSLGGESVYIGRPMVPWLLLLVVVAAVVLWRRDPANRGLVVVAATTFALGVVAVARTIGPAFQYRLYWTFIPPVVAFVIVALAGWRALGNRLAPAVRRGVTGGAVAVLVVLCAINAVAGARAGAPGEGDTAVMRSLTPQVLDALGEVDGPVLISDPYASGTWYARGLVLQLEKHGIRSLVPPERTWEASDHRVHRGQPVAVRLTVVRDEAVAAFIERPDMTLVAEWSAETPERVAEIEAAVADRAADVEAGRLSAEAFVLQKVYLEEELRAVGDAMAYRVGVFRETPEG